MSVVVCLCMTSCALPKSQTRNSQLVEDCKYAIVWDEAAMVIEYYKANELNKIYEQDSKTRMEQIRSTQ